MNIAPFCSIQPLLPPVQTRLEITFVNFVAFCSNSDPLCFLLCALCDLLFNSASVTSRSKPGWKSPSLTTLPSVKIRPRFVSSFAHFAAFCSIQPLLPPVQNPVGNHLRFLLFKIPSALFPPFAHFAAFCSIQPLLLSPFKPGWKSPSLTSLPSVQMHLIRFVSSFAHFATFCSIQPLLTLHTGANFKSQR